MQRHAGNAVTAALIARLAAPGPRSVSPSPAAPGVGAGPSLQRDAADEITSRVSTVVRELHENLVLRPRPNVGVVLEQLLLAKDHQQQMEDAYRSSHHRELRSDLQAKLSWDDNTRAQAYLQYGRLRAADKIAIAVKQPLADEVTVLRVVADIRRISSQDANAEAEFATDYGADLGPVRFRLPNGQSSAIAAAVFATRLGLSEDLGYRIAAILAFGSTRPIDDVVIAAAPRMTTNGPSLFDGLQREKPEVLKSTFKDSYPHLAGGVLTEWITGKTSLHTERRALMLLDEAIPPRERLVRTVEIATSGYTTADADFIFDALQHPTSEQLDYLRVAIASQDPRVKNLYSGLGSLTADDRRRFDALVGTGDKAGDLADPNVLALVQAGGTGDGSVFATLKMTTGARYESFRTGYGNSNSPVRNYVDSHTTPGEKGWLASMVFTDLKSRLTYSLDNPGNDDYVLFLLNAVADGTHRRALANDDAFGQRVANQSTALQNKILLALRPDTMTPTERAIWLDAAVKRETSSGAGSLSASADALTDENRELQAAIKRAGPNPSATDQAEIDQLAGRTDAALQVFVQYRDELEAIIGQAVETVAALVATVATGGAAAPELVLAGLARAAMASAIATVVGNKLVKGDRFDVLGADGAQAFVAGAVDGVLNAVAPLAAEATMERTAAALARSAAPQSFSAFAAGTGKKMTEGAISGGIAGAVDAATRDTTWAQGFDAGMRNIVGSALSGGLTGGVMNGVVPDILAPLISAYGSLEALEAQVDALPEPTGEIAEARIDLHQRGAPAASGPSVQRNNGSELGFEYEKMVIAQLRANQFQGLPPMLSVLSGQDKSGNGIDAMGFAYDEGVLKLYVFEMKWQYLRTDGAPQPQRTLSATKTKGKLQTDFEWMRASIDKFMASETPGARTVKNQLRMQLPSLLGEPRGTRWTNERLQEFLIRRVGVDTVKRVVAIPPWADARKLYKQLINLRRSGQGGYKVIRTGP